MDIEELDIDKLAELETMLYCQVFHSTETEDCQPPNTISMEDNTNVKSDFSSTKPRYFGKQNKRGTVKRKHVWYPKSPDNMNQQQNNPDATSPIQNNITINHYVYNVPGWKYGSDNGDNLDLVNHLKKKLSNRKRPHRKIRNKIKNEIANKMREQSVKDRNHVIFISDDDSSDGCQILTENGGSIDLSKEGTSVSPISSNDEVSFVPSEPCETIDLNSEDESMWHKESEQDLATDVSSIQKDVDAEDESKENSSQKKEMDAVIKKLSSDGNPKAIKNVTSNESHESNDFIDAGVVQDSRDSFDFQLHGSEFNQSLHGGEQILSGEQFVKPPNPSEDAPATECHETESESASSTTTGTDRACSNEFSLKNIVFQEVDFPKADIFADNDLRSFEKFITPQRGNQDSNEGLQEECVAEGARTSKTSTPKAVHTPSPRLLVTAKAPKGRSSAKSQANHAMRSEPRVGEKEGSSEDSESSSESEFESSEGQQPQLPELSLMLQPVTPDSKQKNQEKANTTDAVEVNIDAPEANKVCSSVTESVDDDNTTIENTSTTTVEIPISLKRSDKNKKAKNKKSQLTKNQPDTPNKTSKKRRKGRKATAPQQVEPVESTIHVDVISSNEDVGSDDDLELIEKPLEVIPVTDSDEERDIVEIMLGVEGPFEEAGDIKDNLKLNAVEEKTDKPVRDAPIDLDLVYANLTSDPSKWPISRKDKPAYLALDQRQRSKGPRCNKCRRFGHTALKCTEKPEPPRCYLCGAGNHTEPRCPNKICLNCGNKGDYTTNYCYRCFKYRDLQCRLCSQPGHLAAGCPDLWRRYHNTTEAGPINIPVGPKLRPRNEQWCSGCASQGHLEHECYYYSRQYPPSLPYIISYDNILFPDEAQHAIVSTQNIPKNKINPDTATKDTTQSKDTSEKRTPKYKTPTKRSEQMVNSTNEIGDTPQKRSKCLNEAENVDSVTTPQKPPESASKNKRVSVGVPGGIQSLGEAAYMPTENRLFNLAGYRVQPRMLPEMRLFDIAGYGVPGVTEPVHNGVNGPGAGGVWPRKELIAMNDNVHGQPVSTSTIPSLLSLQFQPRFDINAFDRLPNGEELRLLENHNPDDIQEEIPYHDDSNRYRLGPKSNRKMKNYFLSVPATVLKEFVSSEIARLKRLRKTNIEILKKQILVDVRRHRTMKRNVNCSDKAARKEMHSRELYRRANMFLFGLHQLQLGHRHMTTLRRMVSEEKGQQKGNAEGRIPLKQRMSFYHAYDYVFGDELKRGLNYPSLLDRILNNKKKLKQQQRQQCTK